MSARVDAIAVAAVTAALALACSGKQERRDGGATGRGDAGVVGGADSGAGTGAVADAGVVAVAGDAGAGGAANAASGDAGAGAGAGASLDSFGYTVDEAAAKAGGNVRVIVRWPDTPQARRASPGENDCQRARLPSVVPDELWGVADVVVALTVARGKRPPAAADITLSAETCVVSPRVAVALPGAKLRVANRDASLHTSKVKRHALREGVESLGSVAGGSSRSVRLPWRGHRVELALEEPVTLHVELDGKHGAEDGAWLVVAPTPYAGITDRAGGVLFSGVPAGEVEVKAWIPPRAGAKAVEMSGTVEVKAGQTAELVLTPSGKAAPQKPAPQKPEPAEGKEAGEAEEEGG